MRDSSSWRGGRGVVWEGGAQARQTGRDLLIRHMCQLLQTHPSAAAPSAQESSAAHEPALLPARQASRARLWWSCGARLPRWPCRARCARPLQPGEAPLMEKRAWHTGAHGSSSSGSSSSRPNAPCRHAADAAHAALQGIRQRRPGCAGRRQNGNAAPPCGRRLRKP